MIICHSRKFIFVHIHKTGGTSVELGVERFLSWSDLLLGSSEIGEAINEPYRRRFELNKHSSIAEIEAVCGPDVCNSYFVFATVRHPLHRICSLYNFVAWYVQRYADEHGVSVSDLANQTFSDEEYNTAPELQWAATEAFLASPDFSSFIRDERLGSDDAFRTQLSRLRCAAERTIRVKALRLERRTEWMPKLREILGLPLFTLPHANKSEAKLIIPQQVLPRDRTYIEELFREDYLAFRYQSSE